MGNYLKLCTTIPIFAKLLRQMVLLGFPPRFPILCFNTDIPMRKSAASFYSGSGVKSIRTGLYAKLKKW
jgi:hypothetical protein